MVDYESFDSSGTDDDLPQSHRVVPRGGSSISTNGRPSTLPPSYMYDQVAADMEAQIHHIEKEAYFSLLRAFRAQADAITWEKEGLITEMRKELRVSHEEHRELLARVNADDTIRRIREWRQSGGMQRNAAQVVHETLPSPSVSASMKRHKPNHPFPSQPFASSSPSFHPQADPTHTLASSAAKRGSVPIFKANKHKPVFPGSSSIKPIPYHPPDQQPPRGQVMNRLPSGPTSSCEPTKGTGPESFVGRRVRTRWPEDNTFYEAAISKYDPVEGRHALVYDIGTRNEAWEWVKLAEISPGDIEWIGEDPRICNPYGYNGQGHGLNRTTGPNSVPQRGSGLAKTIIKTDLRTLQNGTGKRKHVDIRLRPTDVLIREVERVLGSHNPDSQEIERAKRVLEEQEHALVGAIAKLGDISNVENVLPRHSALQTIRSS